MSQRIARPVALLAGIIALGGSTVPVSAQLVNEEAVGRLRIGGTVGVLVPSMKEVDRNFEAANRIITADEIRPLDNINEALLTSLDVRFRLGRTPKEDPDDPSHFYDRFTLAFAWGAINARTAIADIERMEARFFSRVTTYYPYLLYEFPFFETSQPRVQVYAGGGPLFLRNARVEWSLTDNTRNAFIFVPGDLNEISGQSKASADGMGLQLQAGFQYMLNSRFSVAVDLGYRWANLTDLTLNEAVGQETRFPGDDPNNPAQDEEYRPGDWAVIDFFFRDKNANWNGRMRTDPKDPDPPLGEGGCPQDPSSQECRLHYTGGDLEVDFSGPVASVSFFVHF